MISLAQDKKGVTATDSLNMQSVPPLNPVSVAETVVNIQMAIYVCDMENGVHYTGFTTHSSTT